MKKIITILLTALMLCACGQKDTPSSSTKASKACSYAENGASITFTAVASDEKSNIESIDFNIDMTYEAMGVTKDTVTDEVKAQLVPLIEQLVLDSYAEEFGSTDGIEIKTEFNDNGINLAFTMGSQALGGEKITLDEFVTEFSNQGYSCK